MGYGEYGPGATAMQTVALIPMPESLEDSSFILVITIVFLLDSHSAPKEILRSREMLDRYWTPAV